MSLYFTQIFLYLIQMLLYVQMKVNMNYAKKLCLLWKKDKKHYYTYFTPMGNNNNPVNPAFGPMNGFMFQPRTRYNKLVNILQTINGNNRQAGYNQRMIALRQAMPINPYNNNNPLTNDISIIPCIVYLHNNTKLINGLKLLIKKNEAIIGNKYGFITKELECDLIRVHTTLTAFKTGKIDYIFIDEYFFNKLSIINDKTKHKNRKYNDSNVISNKFVLINYNPLKWKEYVNLFYDCKYIINIIEENEQNKTIIKKWKTKNNLKINDFNTIQLSQDFHQLFN